MRHGSNMFSLNLIESISSMDYIEIIISRNICSMKPKWYCNFISEAMMIIINFIDLYTFEEIYILYYLSSASALCIIRRHTHNKIISILKLWNKMSKSSYQKL